MGYRPTIICKDTNTEIELGKFYGYIKLDNLKSIEWLKNHKCFTDTDIDLFNLGCYGIAIEFTADEFREFMDLYEKDINDYQDYDYISYPKPYKISDHYKEYEDIYNNEFDKIIEWG